MKLHESKNFPWGTLIATHTGWAYVAREDGAVAIVLEDDHEAPHVRALDAERLNERHGPPAERVLAEVHVETGRGLLLDDGRVRIGGESREAADRVVEAAGERAGAALANGDRDRARSLARWVLLALGRRGRDQPGRLQSSVWLLGRQVAWEGVGRYLVSGEKGSHELDDAVTVLLGRAGLVDAGSRHG